MSRPVRYLTLDEVPVLVRLLGDPAVRDLGLLDCAVHRPRAGFAGEEAYPTVPLKAAALLHSLVMNHALVDGNKRLAWLATDVFLTRHDLISSLGQEEAVDLVLTAITKDLDVQEIADRLRIVRHLQPDRTTRRSADGDHGLAG